MIAIVILVFAVVITPELLCPDRRDRTLTLYFSTAVSRFEYVLGKFIAAALPLLCLTLVPLLFLYAGNVVFAVHPVGYIRDHAGDIVRILAGGLAPAVFFALVGLAVVVAHVSPCVRGGRVPRADGGADDRRWRAGQQHQ